MKGYIDEYGYDRPPCGTCKHRDKMTVQAPCYSCIDNVDLALHKPNAETEFANYEEATLERSKGEMMDRNLAIDLLKAVACCTIPELPCCECPLYEETAEKCRSWEDEEVVQAVMTLNRGKRMGE